MSVNKAALEGLFDGILKPRGFTKKRSSWYRQEDASLQMVDLQKSSYGGQFYINLCCVPAGVTIEGMPTPKEYKCPIRIRVEAAFPKLRKELGKLLDLEDTTIGESARFAGLAELLENTVLPFLEHMRDIDSLKVAIGDGLFKGGMITLAASDHLGLNRKVH